MYALEQPVVIAGTSIGICRTMYIYVCMYEYTIVCGGAGALPGPQVGLVGLSDGRVFPIHILPPVETTS